MLFISSNSLMLTHHLTVERKRQGLSRAQAAAVCNASPSFIRDAETESARCSLGRLLQYMTGLGLSVQVAGCRHWLATTVKNKVIHDASAGMGQCAAAICCSSSAGACSIT